MTKVTDAEGRETEKSSEKLNVAPVDLMRLLEISQKKIPREILGDASEDRVADIHLHFVLYESDPEQPSHDVGLIDGGRSAEV